MHCNNQAFSSVELNEAKQRIGRLQDLEVQVDTTWRGSRWIMDVVSLARDRTVTAGVAVSSLIQQQHSSPLSSVNHSVTPTEVPEDLMTPLRHCNQQHQQQHRHQHQHQPQYQQLQSQQTTMTNGIRHPAADEDPTSAHPTKLRLLTKAKSEHKLLVGRHLSSDAGQLRNNSQRSRSPVCTKCSVPLDLPGYVSSCESCACSRFRFSQPMANVPAAVAAAAAAHGRLSGGQMAVDPVPRAAASAEIGKQYSRSNETLPSPGPPLAQNGTRKAISRSENQLHSLDFQPFLDAEESDNAAMSLGGEAAHRVEPPPIAREEEAANPPKLRRNGSQKGLGSSMRSNSQESECSRRSHSSHTPSLTSLSSADGDPDSAESRSTRSGDAETCDPAASGIIQVYAAYESGLANGTSVKLLVTARTTAREVVDLVVRQLNMAVVLKGKIQLTEISLIL